MRGDREKLEQLILNLFTNAIKFTNPGGRITVTADADEEWQPTWTKGLKIVSSLYRAMPQPRIFHPDAHALVGGDLAAETVEGESRLTLTLLRGRREADHSIFLHLPLDTSDTGEAAAAGEI